MISASVALLFISISGAVVEKRCIAFHEFGKGFKTVTRYSEFFFFKDFFFNTQNLKKILKKCLCLIVCFILLRCTLPSNNCMSLEFGALTARKFMLLCLWAILAAQARAVVEKEAI